MLVSVNLTQENKKGNVSFNANKIFNIGEENVSTISIEIASFCKELQTLIAKNKKLGYNPVEGIRKSLPMQINLNFDGETLSMNYRNFGKFVEESTKKNIEKFLKQNIEFNQKWG